MTNISCLDLVGGQYFFNAVRDGDSVLYACDDENECHLWVMAMYRATGQAHKPTPPINIAGKNSTIAKLQGGKNHFPIISIVMLMKL
jgi:calcium-dependent secretion activator